MAITTDIPTGVIIGAAGGLVAGLTLWIIGRLNEYEIEWRERRRIFKWLDRVTAPSETKKWRSTRAIASFNNLTEDRVRHLCSRHPRIVLSTKEKEMWGILGRAREEEDVGMI